MQVSKWLKIQALLDADEMQELFAEIDCALYDVSQVIDQTGPITQELFIQKYSAYVDALKMGKQPDIKPLRPYFSAALSKKEPNVQEVRGRFLYRCAEPVIQMQHHTFILSADKCLSMVHGKNSISWGIQFAYPQMAMDEQGTCSKTRTHPNGEAFKKLQKWMRASTTPMTFDMNGIEKTYPIRLGKKCKQWIHNHPSI